MLDQWTLRIVDVAAEARSVYGDQADYMCGRTLPAHEYRIEATHQAGTRVTFHYGATTDDVADYLLNAGCPPTN